MKDINKIIIADDDLEMLSILASLLEEEGFDVIKVENGEEAVKASLKELPTLILLDIHMPKMNGLEACKKIKANPATMNIPIVMLTVDGSLSEVRHALNYGAKSYITKPFTKKEIIGVVKSILD
ncbi:MAG: response regulator [Elusimicrobia bacterium]|nr:response regulator [Elusimicrobiota bacterium]